MIKAQEHPLVTAARQLADDLGRFETQSGDLGRLTINSEKTLQRARQGLEACAQHELKVAESLRGFAEAMQATQAAQQHCMALATEAAARVQQRQQQRQVLQERLAALGRKAQEVSAPAASLPESPDTPPSEVLTLLAEVERRLDAVIADAAQVCELAKQDDWTDLQRDTESLLQQLQMLRNRVLLWRRKLNKDAPS